MKKHGFYLTVFAVIILFTSCGTTKQIVLHTTEPSPVELSNQIKRIGVIANAESTTDMEGETNGMNRLVLAQEKWLTKKGKDAAINGLFDELLKDNRFEEVKMLEQGSGETSDFGSNSSGIPWSNIESLCTKNNVDAVFAMAFYETDTKVSVKKTSMLDRNLIRDQVKVKAQEITLETLIENGWRIYYPQNRQVIDEIVFNDQITSTGKGKDALAAYQAIGDRKETLMQQSRTNGSQYGQRLLPFKNSVSREYYIKGTDNLVLANELAENEDWSGAKKVLELDVEHQDAKIRRRSCHNLAVLSERVDNLEEALSWASKAYEYDNNGEDLEYIDILKKRIDDKKLLKSQLAYLQFE
ncbi:DUF6340 family protein [Maribacter halichondriae]|uniref:DUF6340 family protein n=1 Tax=Maribacter halichondriae TaxID=2980554 RepID=UPI002359B111|nr:DUF6340 family protein [Maribacter sp. Hal144]